MLPLHNYTGDPEQEYFVNGFQDALISALGQLSDLRVISKTSTLRYKEGTMSLQEIAKELDVDAIIEGSVNGKGSQIRIQLVLIKAFPKETHIWTNEYEQNLGTLPILQSQIVRSIAGEVDLTISPQEEYNLAQKREVNPEAQKAYMQGIFHWDRLSRKDLDLALQYFQKSIDIDPEFAPGYAGIASVWVGRLQQGLVSFSEGVANGRVAAQRALSLDSTMSPVYGTLGGISGWVDWNYAASEDYFKRSIVLNPNNAKSHAYLAHILLIRHRADEAMEHMDVALELDPFNQLYRGLYAMSLNFTHQYDRSIRELEEVLEVNPYDRIALSTLRTSYHMREDYEKAYHTWVQSYEARNDRQAIEYLEQGYKSGGYSGALSELAGLLIARSDTSYVTPWQIGTLYTRAGRKTEAMGYIKKAYEAHDSNMPYIGIDPIFAIFKDSDEFQDLLGMMNLKP